MSFLAWPSKKFMLLSTLNVQDKEVWKEGRTVDLGGPQLAFIPGLNMRV